MITATRKLAHELEDGSLEVVLQVHPQHKVAFFNTFPKAGLWVALAPAEKPPTQGAAPVATEPPQPPQTPANASLLAELNVLTKSPWFQQYVGEVSPATAVRARDAEHAAQIYLAYTTSGGGRGAPNAEQAAAVKKSFHDWCDTKGYRQDA